MSFKYVVDSSAWYEYLDGSEKGTKIHALIDSGKTAIAILGVAELADKFERENKAFDRILQFIQSKAAILPVTLFVVQEAAKIKKKQRALKNKFGLVDALHLATAKEHAATFITVDNDFRGVDNVIIL